MALTQKASLRAICRRAVSQGSSSSQRQARLAEFLCAEPAAGSLGRSLTGVWGVRGAQWEPWAVPSDGRGVKEPGPPSKSPQGPATAKVAGSQAGVIRGSRSDDPQPWGRLHHGARGGTETRRATQWPGRLCPRDKLGIPGSTTRVCFHSHRRCNLHTIKLIYFMCTSQGVSANLRSRTTTARSNYRASSIPPGMLVYILCSIWSLASTRSPEAPSAQPEIFGIETSLDFLLPPRPPWRSNQKQSPPLLYSIFMCRP